MNLGVVVGPLIGTDGITMVFLSGIIHYLLAMIGVTGLFIGVYIESIRKPASAFNGARHRRLSWRDFIRNKGNADCNYKFFNSICLCKYYVFYLRVCRDKGCISICKFIFHCIMRLRCLASVLLQVDYMIGKVRSAVIYPSY